MPLTNSIASRRLPFPVVRLVRQREHRPRGGATAQQQTVLPVLLDRPRDVRGDAVRYVLPPEHNLRDVFDLRAGVVPPQPRGDRHRVLLRRVLYTGPHTTALAW